MEETRLVRLAQQGDADAFEALVQRNQELAFRTAYLIVGETREAEEGAQDAFVKAYYALSRFRLGEPFRPWLLRIVANEARNRRKAAKRRDRLALRAAEDRLFGEPVSSPEVAVLTAERRQSLLTTLNRLREEDRLVIAYRYFLDLDEAEMAAALDCARGTVKSRLSRALARLREELARSSSGTRSDWMGAADD
ncbi:MAG: sigma-70 family RNA polymerase sigma factor [Chloroflexi bacterium]|nr:sigma-70 family RNA polymerase sigma factor [Chloroflexota bacterium]